MHCVVAGHYRLAAGNPYHRLVRHQDLLHQLFLLAVAASAVAKVVLAGCRHAVSKTAILQSLHESDAQAGRQVSILAETFFKTVEGRVTDHVKHR